MEQQLEHDIRSLIQYIREAAHAEGRCLSTVEEFKAKGIGEDDILFMQSAAEVSARSIENYTLILLRTVAFAMGDYQSIPAPKITQRAKTITDSVPASEAHQGGKP